jgi:hypothetical protein
VIDAYHSSRSKKGYVPDELVVNYMLQKLHFEKRRNNERLRGRELVEDAKYSSLKKRKTDVLDRIFKSMANLIFFFQCISNYSELSDVFDDDIKDLLGIRRKDPQRQVLGFVFLDLLRSILKVEKEPTKQQSEKDFRLHLSHLLQIVISDKVSSSIVDTFTNGHARVIVKDDFTRAWAWTRMIADKVDLDMEEDLSPHRTFDFDTDKLLAEKIQD